MKTQINHLRTGRKNQILNSQKKDEKIFGSNYNEVSKTWKKVTEENPEKLTVIIFGEKIELHANWSVSRKSVDYFGIISEDFLKKVGLVPAKKETPYISIQDANEIIVSNGKKSYIYLDPGLVEII